MTSIKSHANMLAGHATAIYEGLAGYRLTARNEVEEVEDDPLALVRHCRRLLDLASQLEPLLIEEARAKGVTWADIGNEYGTSRQAAQQRFSAR